MGVIKTILSTELKIPVCKQELSGWKLDRPPRDATLLESLNLPKDNVLYLSINGNDRDVASDEYVNYSLFFFLNVFRSFSMILK